MSGHLTCTATLSKSRHISTLNYLRSADTCLTRTRTVIYWLSVPAITYSANKCHVFGGHFNPKSLTARTLTCDRQFFQMSMLPSGDRKQYFISRVNSCVMNHVIVAIQTISWFGYIRFTTSRRKSHVCYVKPAVLKKRTILSFDQCASCRALAFYSSWCGKTQIARIEANRSSGHNFKEPSWPSGIRAAGLIWNTLSAKRLFTLTTTSTRVRLLYNTSADILLWCIDFRFNNYSIHNYDNAWHCIQYHYRWWWCSRVRCTAFGTAHPSLRWAATCHVRTLLPGPEGVRSWQVLL